MNKTRDVFTQSAAAYALCWVDHKTESGREKVLVQPYHDKDTLKSRVSQAQRNTNRVGEFLAQLLGGAYFGRKKPKCDRRLEDKALKYGGDYAYVRDMSCGTLALPTRKIRNAIDLVCGENADAAVLHAALKELGVVAIAEIENNFSAPGSSNLRNLNMKFALETTLNNGQKSYDVVEFQVVADQAIPYHKKSHVYFEQLREAKAERQKSLSRVARAEHDMQKPGLIPRTYQRLQETIDKETEKAEMARLKIEESRLHRRTANQMAVKATQCVLMPGGVDELVGYEPRRDSMAEMLPNAVSALYTPAELNAHVA